MFFDFKESGGPWKLGVEISFADINHIGRINQCPDDINNYIGPEGYFHIELFQFLSPESAADITDNADSVMGHAADKTNSGEQMGQE